MNNKIIAVTGATGQQGGAVVRKLLADGWNVRALTRDLNKPTAQELEALGAELVAGLEGIIEDEMLELEDEEDGQQRHELRRHWFPPRRPRVLL